MDQLPTMVAMYKVIPWAFLTSFAGTVLFDVSQLQGPVYSELPRSTTLWVLISCSMAFLVNYSAILVAGKSSALTYTLLGQFKLCVIIAMGMIFFDATPTPKGLLGVTIALTMIFVYSFVTLRDQAQVNLHSVQSSEREPAAKS